MRRRYGQNVSESGSENVEPVREKEVAEPVGEGAVGESSGKKEFSWLNAITAASQLTLDIIRVIREATDLYRRLFPGR